MDFFARQAETRRLSRWLVLLFILAIVAIVLAINLVVVIAVAIPALGALFRWVVAERVGTIVLSAIVAHSAWHWMAARFAALREYRFVRPALDAAFAASLLRGLMLLLIVGGVSWLVAGTMARLAGSAARGKPKPGVET